MLKEEERQNEAKKKKKNIYIKTTDTFQAKKVNGLFSDDDSNTLQFIFL